MEAPATTRRSFGAVVRSAPSRLWRATLAATARLPIPVAVIYLLSTIFNLLAFNQGDLSHTVASSYAYLFGHGVDFYDYNAEYLKFNDYFPTTYIVFAVWMAPVKMLVSPGVQSGMALSPVEVAWAKLLLLLLFWATFLVVSKIAKELFPEQPQRQLIVRLAFLLSPLAAFAFNCFGQYDILGVFFAALGFLFYLRGDKWKFAVFFALAASSKYFALLIFLPLVLLSYKKLRDIVLLGLIGISVLVIEGLAYLPNTAFREYTLFGLASDKVTGAGTQVITTVVAIVFVVGCVVLWRKIPTPQTLGPIAVFTVIVVYGMMFAAVSWHPQWFIILTPFFAMALGYLRRPVWFLVWDSLFFLIFIWIVGNRWVGNVDFTMLDRGALRDVLGDAHLLVSDFYPLAALPVLNVLLLFYLFSPLAAVLVERARGALPPADARPVGAGIWMLRVLTLPLVWTLPLVISLATPASVAVAINPRASVSGMLPTIDCAIVDTAYGELSDGILVEQTFEAASNDLSAISFRVATYERTAVGVLELTLVDDTDRVVAQTTIDLSTVTDNADQYFVFSPLRQSGDATYTLEVATRGTDPGDGVAIWGSADDCFPVGRLEMNGVRQSGDLALSTFYDPR